VWDQRRHHCAAREPRGILAASWQCRAKVVRGGVRRTIPADQQRARVVPRLATRVRRAYERVAARWPWLAPVLLVFALSRLAFYVVALPGAYMLPDAPDQVAAVDVNARLPLALHWRWDAIHYYTVSIDGYSPGGTTAFFPLLPALMHGVAFVLGGFQSPAQLPIQEAQRAPLLAGVLVAHAVALLAIALLYRLAREEAFDRDGATRVVLYAMLFPFAFHYAVPYTEGLLLAASAGAFLAMRRGRWLQAGGWAALASASRSGGILLAPVLAFEIALAWRAGRLPRRDWPRAALGLLLAPAGLLAFMAVLWWQADDPFAFVSAQEQWGRELTNPLETLWRGVDYALHPSLSDHADVYARGVMGLVVLAFLAIFAVSWRRWRPSYVLYGVLYVVVVLSSPIEGEWTMHHMGRFLMPFFPIFFTLAWWGRRPWVHTTILVTFLPLYGMLTALFVNWYAT
jgi:hypothetical protein